MNSTINNKTVIMPCLMQANNMASLIILVNHISDKNMLIGIVISNLSSTYYLGQFIKASDCLIVSEFTIFNGTVTLNN